MKQETSIELLLAAEELRDYISGPECIIKGFDIPDILWLEFNAAIIAARKELDNHEKT